MTNEINMKTLQLVNYHMDESILTVCLDGNAQLAWAKLQSKFESQTSVWRVKLMNQFTNNKLHKLSQDPDVWSSELELLRTRLKKWVQTLTRAIS